MLSRLALRVPQSGIRHVARPEVALRPLAARSFALHAINSNMIDSDYNAPSSEKALYTNEFIQKPAAEHVKDMETAVKQPVVHDPKDLMPAHAGDPHQTYGIAEWRHVHYDVAREPTFPRKP